MAPPVAGRVSPIDTLTQDYFLVCEQYRSICYRLQVFHDFAMNQISTGSSFSHKRHGRPEMTPLIDFVTYFCPSGIVAFPSVSPFKTYTTSSFRLKIDFWFGILANFGGFRPIDACTQQRDPCVESHRLRYYAS
jgi:hypothetical protein